LAVTGDLSQYEIHPGRCLNCDSSKVTLAKPLYCSDVCCQSADLVRYVRARRKEGRENEPDFAEAILMKTAMVLGGTPKARVTSLRQPGNLYWTGQKGNARTADRS